VRAESAVWELWEESIGALQGSRSRPKAAMLTAATIALQAAKKSHAALERNESLRVMTVDPLSGHCPVVPVLSDPVRYQHSVAGARRAREASRRAIKELSVMTSCDR
jgi:hypothetical protein